MKRVLVSLILCVVVVGVGLVATQAGTYFRKAQAKVETPAENVKAKAVNVAVLKAQTVEDRLVLTGVVEPWEDVLLSSEAQGKLEWQGVKEGQRVEAGQELARIETALLRAQLDQAQAHARLAEQELQRLRTLSEKGVATAQNMDKAQAERDVAAANLRLIQTQVDKSVLRAPFGGVIDKLFKDESELVEMGAPLVRLVQTHKVKMKIGIPERDISYFAPGDRQMVRLDALRDREFPGVIYKIGTIADDDTLTFRTEVEVDNAEGVIKPGMIGRVSLVRKRYPDSIVVPMFSILSVENQRFVFVEQDGVAHVRPIEIGVIQETSVQATSGLSAGDRLIVVGQRDLKEGDSVKVMEVVE